MRTKAKNKILSALLMALLMLGVFAAPMTAYAVDIGAPSNTHPAVDVATGAVYYGGKLYRVVAKDSNTMTLFCDGRIDASGMRYDSSSNNDWSGSDICQYLNNPSAEFLSTLSAAEQAAIPAYGTTEVRNSFYPGSSPDDDIDISQKILLPSYDEVRDNGTWNMTQSDRYLMANWHLRSPGDTTSVAALVDAYGLVTAGIGSTYHVRDAYAIRPVFKLNLNSVILTSNAAGGKSVAVGDTLESVPQAPTGEVKLTVLDSGLSLSSANVTGVSGNTIMFDYTITGSEHNRLSVIVQAADGSVKYYGNLKGTPGASGTDVDVTVPDGLASTDKLLVFAEQVNAPNYTDFASAPVQLTRATPAGLAAVAETAALNDGKITGTTADMEYSADGTTWYACSATETTGLAGGAYQVRYKAQTVNGIQAVLASAAQTVTVGAYNAPLPNPPSTGSGSYTPTYTRRTLTDTPTGVKVTAGMGLGIRLNVTANTLHPPGSCAACDEIRARQAAGDVLKLYDISLTGYHTGAYEVFIPFSGSDGYYTVLHCNKGLLEKQNGSYVNGGVSTIWANLSPFAVVRGADIAVPDNVVVDPPKTGDAGSIGGFALMLTGLCGMAGLRAARRRKVAG